MTSQPAIGVVVLHYGADDLTMRCLRALVADGESPSTRVVLVDNGPGSSFARRVRGELPSVQVVEPGTNLGFAAGCNLGIKTLGETVDLVALVNSDVLVRPGWLAPLVEVLTDPSVAAACPKILFEGRFRRVEVTADRTWCPGRGDRRELSWRLRGATHAGDDLAARVQRVEGFWEPEDDGEWAGPRAVLHVPEIAPDRLELQVEAPPRTEVTLRVHPPGTEVTLMPGASVTVEVPDDGPAVAVINNVGNDWRSDGYGIDLGFMEIDAGQREEAVDVPAWCGGAVLLRRRYLDETDGFDERLFLYYEDLELSLRGARHGWRYRYEPLSVVEHRHAASFGSDPAGIARRRERNRLLVLLRHGTRAQAARAWVRFGVVTASYLRRDVVAPLLRGERPRSAIVWSRAGALCQAVAMAPSMLRSRRGDARSDGMRALV